jgi:hypothetical protein
MLNEENLSSSNRKPRYTRVEEADCSTPSALNITHNIYAHGIYGSFAKILAVTNGMPPCGIYVSEMEGKTVSLEEDFLLHAPDAQQHPFLFLQRKKGLTNPPSEHTRPGVPCSNKYNC